MYKTFNVQLSVGGATFTVFKMFFTLTQCELLLGHLYISGPYGMWNQTVIYFI